MLKNNVEVDVKVKCIESGSTQAKLADEIGTSAPYVSTIIANESYETFAQQLQNEIEEETGVSFKGKIDNKRERKNIRLV